MEIYKKISDLLIVLVWVGITFVFAIIPIDISYIRELLVIPTILFIPGYLLTTSLFIKKEDLQTVTRIALSFGLSLVIILFLGLILNFTLGIKLIPIIQIMSIYDIFLVLITFYRRQTVPLDDQFTIDFEKIYNNIISNLPKSERDAILSIILMAMIIITIGTIYYTIEIPKIGERFTEFYILNASGKDDYPTNIGINAPANLLVGVTNHEQSSVNYTVDVVLNGTILASKKLLLEDSEIWEDNVTFIRNEEYNDTKLEFLLFKENNTIPYRTLHLWINAT